MKRNSIRERAKTVPAEIKSMVSLSMATAKEINKILERQGKNQRDLANMLGKRESEISKWMRGTHNFTFLTICKIEHVLNERIILLPEEAIQNIYVLNSIRSDAEQTICIKNTQEKGYTFIEKGKKLKIEQSASVSQDTGNKLQILDCFN